MSEVQNVDWGALAEKLKSEGTGPFFFTKSNKTRVRLWLPNAQNPLEFYRTVESFFRGKQKTKYMVFGVVMGTEENGVDKPLSEKWVNVIAPVIITKTALQGIISLLAEGYDLFSAEAGHGITIVKTGSGTDTDYTVLASPKAVPVKWDDMKALENAPDELVAMFNTRGQNKTEEKESNW